MNDLLQECMPWLIVGQPECWRALNEVSCRNHVTYHSVMRFYPSVCFSHPENLIKKNPLLKFCVTIPTPSLFTSGSLCHHDTVRWELAIWRWPHLQKLHSGILGLKGDQSMQQESTCSTTSPSPGPCVCSRATVGMEKPPIPAVAPVCFGSHGSKLHGCLHKQKRLP